MLKTLLRQVRQYKVPALLTPVWTSLEVVMGILIPYATASIIDKGIGAGDMGQVLRYGAIMVGIACMSLLFGILAGRFAAYSSTGLAANLREAMYENIQRFSFSDIDKFSTSGLITRMTTDVSNIQNAFQMLLRTSFRAPLNMVSALLMCFFINGRLSIIFLVAMLILMVFLTILITRAARLFKEIFRRYDDLNAVVQENVNAIRVVKAFVREHHELGKFDKAALNLYTLNVKAESLMALNHPVMNLVVNACIIALSWWGAHFIVGGTLQSGSLTTVSGGDTTFAKSVKTGDMRATAGGDLTAKSTIEARGSLTAEADGALRLAGDATVGENLYLTAHEISVRNLNAYCSETDYAKGFTFYFRTGKG